MVQNIALTECDILHVGLFRISHYEIVIKCVACIAYLLPRIRIQYAALGKCDNVKHTIHNIELHMCDIFATLVLFVLDLGGGQKIVLGKDHPL